MDAQEVRTASYSEERMEWMEKAPGLLRTVPHLSQGPSPQGGNTQDRDVTSRRAASSQPWHPDF
jgi:hypothetical protein